MILSEERSQWFKCLRVAGWDVWPDWRVEKVPDLDWVESERELPPVGMPVMTKIESCADASESEQSCMHRSRMLRHPYLERATMIWDGVHWVSTVGLIPAYWWPTHWRAALDFQI